MSSLPPFLRLGRALVLLAALVLPASTGRTAEPAPPVPPVEGGWRELKTRQPGMMLLISLAITVAFAASWVTTLGIGGFELDFWWELALLVTITHERRLTRRLQPRS